MLIKLQCTAQSERDFGHAITLLAHVRVAQEQIENKCQPQEHQIVRQIERQDQLGFLSNLIYVTHAVVVPAAAPLER